MKILLTNPIKIIQGTPTSFGLIQPIHLMYLASYLERQGHIVKIFDTVVEKSVKKYIRTLNIFKPDVVGIGAVSNTIYSAWDTAELVKKHTNATVVMGGDHVSFLPGETFFCCPFVDYVVRGEGEITFADLLDYLQGKKELEKIRGISYRKEGKVFHNPNRPCIENLDELPRPAWHLVDMYKYVQMVGKSGLFVSSRGCSRGCSFCISCRKLGLNWRPRSAESVVEEMMLLAETYPNLDNLVAIDDNFMEEIERVEKICDLLIKNNFNKPWICQGRADTILEGGERLTRKMKKAGCLAIQIGIESPFKDRLKAVNKGINKNDALKAIKIVQSADIFVRGTFLFGFEYETKEKMWQTLKFAMGTGVETVQLAIITPFVGSPFFEKMKHKLNTHDWRRFTVAHQLINYENDLDAEKELNRIFLRFNLRPKFLKLARQLKVKQFWTIGTLFYAFVKSIIGNKNDYLIDSYWNKWMNISEVYWQNYILKNDLTFEKNWYFDEPKIECLEDMQYHKILEATKQNSYIENIPQLMNV